MRELDQYALCFRYIKRIQIFQRLRPQQVQKCSQCGIVIVAAPGSVQFNRRDRLGFDPAQESEWRDLLAARAAAVLGRLALFYVALPAAIVALTMIFYGAQHFLFPRFVPGVPLEKPMPAWMPAPCFDRSASA